MPDQVNTIKTDAGVEVYENAICDYLQQYIDERGIEDMSKEPQSKWNAALIYINKYVFINNDELMSDINNSMYDEYKVNKICDIYINLCYEYDKEISINGFHFLTGINRDTLYSWKNEETRNNIYYDSKGNRISNIQMWKINHPKEEYRQEFSSSCSDIYKKLVANNEESLSCKLISGGLNPMKVLPALNRRHNWNMPGNSNPGGEQKQSIEQIQERYKVEKAPDQPQLPPPDADF